MKNTISILLALSLLLSCAGESDHIENDREIRKAISEMNDAAKSSLKVPEYPDLSQFKVTPIEPVDATSEFNSKLCEIINQKNLDNPFALEELMEEGSISKVLDYLKMLNGRFDCLMAKDLIDEYPVKFVKVSTQSGPSPIFAFNMAKSGKAKGINIIYDHSLDVKLDMVEMSDGVKLGTFTFTKNDGPRPVIYVRTPYFHGNPAGYLNYAHRFLGEGYNLVIQENRGAHLSGGDFRWLHNENIQDGKDSVDWIVAQGFSNGEVVPYGVSYDGFNALATAASNAEGITHTVACSAPANVATDSFTGSRKMQLRLLTYIWDREENTSLNFFYEKVNYVLESKYDAMENLDKYIFGRELADWTDFSASMITQDEAYWTARNLLPKLRSAIKPIYHVAGLAMDQDGRDTVLAYNYLKENSEKFEDDFFYLHKGGHGCGDFEQSSEYDKFMSKRYSELPKAIAYSVKEDRNMKLSEYNGTLGEHKEFALDFNGNGSQDWNGINLDAWLNDDMKSTWEGKYVVAELPFNEKTIINGSPKLKINIRNYSYLSFLNIGIKVFRPDGSELKVHGDIGLGSTRSGYYFKESDYGQDLEVEVELQPIALTMHPGYYMQVELATKSFFSFDFHKNRRASFYSQNGGKGVIAIIGGEKSTKLTLPVE